MSTSDTINDGLRGGTSLGTSVDEGSSWQTMLAAASTPNLNGVG